MINRRNILTRIAGVAALAAAALVGRFRAVASAREETIMTRQEMIDQFKKHVDAELAGDLDTTMATMGDNPHLTSVPTIAGGVGRDGVRAFYRDHLVGKFFPPDVEMTTVSVTVDENQLVEENVFTFTHTTEIDWLLPGVAPTGRRVEMALVVIVGFSDGKVAHEHVYWDQAGVLVQIGLLDPAGLPVTGAESARKILDPSLPPRKF